MPNPVADINVVMPLVWDELNTATAVYGTFNDNANGNNPRWQPTALLNWCVNADLEIQRAICETEGSPYRNYFVQSTPFEMAASGGAMPPEAVGSPESIWVTGTDDVSLPGKHAAYEWILEINGDTTGAFGPASLTDRYYSQIGERLYFTGASAQVYYCKVTRATTSALLVPPAFTNTLVKAVCGWACAKESDFLDESREFLRQYYEDLNSIRQGAMTVPPVQQAQMAGV